MGPISYCEGTDPLQHGIKQGMASYQNGTKPLPKP